MQLPSGFTNHKSDIPKKTIVLAVPEVDIDRLKLLIRAYKDDLPEMLGDFLTEVDNQLGGQFNGR